MNGNDVCVDAIGPTTVGIGAVNGLTSPAAVTAAWAGTAPGPSAPNARTTPVRTPHRSRRPCGSLIDPTPPSRARSRGGSWGRGPWPLQHQHQAEVRPPSGQDTNCLVSHVSSLAQPPGAIPD